MSELTEAVDAEDNVSLGIPSRGIYKIRLSPPHRSHSPFLSIPRDEAQCFLPVVCPPKCIMGRSRAWREV